MRMIWALGTAVSLGLLLTACGEGDDGGSRVCEPGATQDCSCGSGRTGYQTCMSTGEGWGSCQGCGGCTPATCGEMGWECGSGTETDCGTTINCGSCGSGETCSAGRCTTDPCATHTSCSTCTPAGSCGWCQTLGQCMTGSSSGPSFGSCSNWSWTSSECPCSNDPDCDSTTDQWCSGDTRHYCTRGTDGCLDEQTTSCSCGCSGGECEPACTRDDNYCSGTTLHYCSDSTRCMATKTCNDADCMAHGYGGFTRCGAGSDGNDSCLCAPCSSFDSHDGHVSDCGVCPGNDCDTAVLSCGTFQNCSCSDDSDCPCDLVCGCLWCTSTPSVRVCGICVRP